MEAFEQAVRGSFGGVTPWLNLFKGIRILAIVLDVLLLGLLVFSIQRGLRFRPRLRPSRVSSKTPFTLRDALLRERWNLLLKKTATGAPDALKIAVIDADKLVDDVLQQLGFQGEHMADRLEQFKPGELRSFERVSRAHRIRNQLVHSPGFTLTPEEAKRTLLDYQAFLREVGVLAPVAGGHGH